MRLARTRLSRNALTPLVFAVAAALAAACRVAEQAPGAGTSGTSRGGSAVDTAAIADTLRRLVLAAYDFSRPGQPSHLLNLYPDGGEVISAYGGRLVTSRDSLEASIRRFWDEVGRNMRDPRWVWRETHVDVFSPDAAVFTGTYEVPHRTPAGVSHVIGGAWTMVFERRGGRWVIVQEHLSDTPDRLGPAATDTTRAGAHVGH